MLLHLFLAKDGEKNYKNELLAMIPVLKQQDDASLLDALNR